MLRSILSLVFAVAIATFAVPAQDEARVLTAFDKVFTPPPKGKATVDDKLKALQTLAGLDSAKVTEELVEAWQHVAGELALADAEREDKNQEMQRLIAGQEGAEQRTLDQSSHARFNQLKTEVAALRTRCDAIRTLLASVGDRLAEARKRDSLLWLLTHVFGHKKITLPLKLAAARAVGGAAAEVLEELTAALVKAKDPEEQLALLDAFALAGTTAQAHATPVIALLESKEEAVAERAAKTLAKLAVADAIGPMIALLSRSEGQPRLRIAASLEVLTGQQFGANASVWRAWWQQDGQMFVTGKQPLGQGTPSSRGKGDEGRYYFGIPQQDSKSILYVIDCSGSMKAEIDWPGKDGQPVKTTRMDACKLELIRALGLLRPAQRFAVLWYNDQPHFWEPKMQPATPEAIARAQAFVDTLKHAQSTNIHDSLEQAFKLVGRGAKDKYYGVELDTIFLLTDGSPTTSDGKQDSTEKILVGVRSWNPLQRVTVHCIAIGKDLNEPFLRQLAQENGGEFKRF